MNSKSKVFIPMTISIALLIIAITLYYHISIGTFRNAPILKATADNCYDETLHVVFDNDYYPFSAVTQNGDPTGHDVEMITIIANRLQMNLDLQPMDWSECLEAAEAGKADVILTCEPGDTESAEGAFYMTIPTEYDQFVAFGVAPISSPDGLFNKRIGVMENGNVYTYICSYGLENNLVFYKSNADAIEGMIKGECDYVACRYIVGNQIISDKKYNNVHAFVSIGNSNIAIGVVKDPELVEKINQTIVSMKNDGTLTKLNEKWLTYFSEKQSFSDLASEHPWILFLIGLCVAGIMYMLFVFYFKRRQTAAIEEQESIRKTLEQRVFENNKRMMAITDDLESLYDVELDTHFYETMIKSQSYYDNVTDKLINNSDFFSDTLNNAKSIIFEEDLDNIGEVLAPDYIVKALEIVPYYEHYYRLMIADKPTWFKLRVTYKDESKKNVLVGVFNAEREMQARAELEDALNMSEAASKAKTTFLFNMSHDIRTPMNAIIGFNNMAIRDIDDREKALDSLEKVKTAGNMLLSLINDVLDMSRIESGKVTLTENESDMEKSFRGIEPMLQELAQAKDISLTFSIHDITDRYNYVDFARTERVLVNVISNAIKYTQEGGKVSVELYQAGTKDTSQGTMGIYRYVVRDNGIGMSQEFQAHMFEEFSRERNTTTSGIQGTGLGLALVKALMDLFHGTITCESTPGEGSTFILEFPFRLREAPSEKASDASSDQEDEIDLSGKKVLLADDYELNREIATDILTEHDMFVECAEDGREAVEMVKKRGIDYYDFILMDIQMPYMNGYEAAEEIRRLFPERHIPIIALSANAFEEDRQKSLDHGMDEHVAKPINVKKLINTLGKVNR